VRARPPLRMIRIDLHLHSDRSDGTLSPERLVCRIHSRRVAVAALTDHDGTDGVAAFLRGCRERGIRGIGGIELSARAGHTLHIVGLRVDPGAPELVGGIEVIRRGREDRNAGIFRKLAEIGVPVSREEAEREARGNILGRPHIARAIVRKGYASSGPEAFVRFLARGAAAYVSRYRPEPEEAIRWIREAGGVAVLAHPGQCGLDAAGVSALAEDLRDKGLWGIECLTSRHSNEQALFFLRLAERLGLYPTAGTDFHGDNTPGVEPGVSVGEDLLPWARLGVRL